MIHLTPDDLAPFAPADDMEAVFEAAGGAHITTVGPVFRHPGVGPYPGPAAFSAVDRATGVLYVVPTRAMIRIAPPAKGEKP